MSEDELKYAAGWLVKYHGDIFQMVGLSQWAEKEGSRMTLLGSGYFSRAYKLQGLPLVIKVGRDEDNYSTYLDWVEEQGDCAYCPKVYARRQVDGPGGRGYNITILEQLTPFYMYSEELSNYARTLHYVTSTDDDVVTWAGNTWFQKHDSGYKDWVQEHLADPFMEFVAALRKFRDEAPRCLHWDLHDGNYMVRLRDGQPQFVLTDPVA